MAVGARVADLDGEGVVFVDTVTPLCFGGDTVTVTVGHINSHAS